METDILDQVDETDITGEFSLERFRAKIAGAVGVVLFDIDNTLASGDGSESAHFRMRPHVQEVMDGLRADGHEIVLWSAGGADHAKDIAQFFDAPVRSFHHKPPLIPDGWCPADVVKELIGDVPVLSVDDDYDERIIGVPFARVRSFWAAKIPLEAIEEYEEEVFQAHLRFLKRMR